MKIRLAHELDLTEIMAISEAADSAAQWTQQQWLTIFHSQSPTRLAWIAEGRISEDEVAEKEVAIGFLVAQNSGPEWELENIAVLPACRRKGVGFGLLCALLTHAGTLLAERILLEVRASNESAINFYNVSGFRLLARRREYYCNPTEDALILVHPV